MNLNENGVRAGRSGARTAAVPGQRSKREPRNEIMIRYQAIAFVADSVTDIARPRHF